MIEAEPSDFLHEERARRYTYSWRVRIARRLAGLLITVVYFLGYDLSAWQIQANPALAKSNGMLFAFIRALYGLMVDVKFPLHWGTHRGVLKRGPYLYYRDNEDPVAQAQKLYATCVANGDLGELPPVVDIESINNPTLTASKIRLCVEEVNRLFGDVMIYTGFYVWRDEVQGDKSWASAYKLMIAAYPFFDWKPEYFELVKLYPPMIPWPWTFFSVWQFTSKLPAAEYGVSGTYLDGDYATEAFATAYGLTPPPAPGDDEMKAIKCTCPGDYLFVRVKPITTATTGGKFYRNATAQTFPAQTHVVKPDLPNKEIWLPCLLPDNTLGWVAQWHPVLKDAQGHQVEAVQIL